jgi:hypothetical protein
MWYAYTIDAEKILRLKLLKALKSKSHVRRITNGNTRVG